MASERIHSLSSQYLQLTTKIAEIEWVDSQLLEQTNYLQDLQVKVAVKRSELDKLREKTKKEFQEVQNLKHFTVKRLAAQLTNRLEKKLKKEETDYLAAFEKEQNEKTTLEMLENELREATQLNQILTSQKKELVSLKDQLNNLVDSAFTELMPEGPLEIEVGTLYAQFNQVAVDVNRYQSAEKHIGNARITLSQAIKSLRQAHQYNSLDMYSHNRIADFFERGSLADARKYSMQAQVQIDQARQFVPEIRYMNVTQGNFVFGVLFDNFFVDYYIRSKIESSLRSLLSHLTQLDSVYQWLQNNISNLGNIYTQMQSTYISKRQELSKERIKMFERVLNPNNTTSSIPNASDIPIVSSSNYEEDDELPSYDEALRQPTFM
ncbi:6067_t:CDS:2 [Dentiscutata erythropus]|uniref:6067_t:CDS:1 n=1 Tax=Dentiscutata erythropus TaxID=1348616 RepID=A0A9N9A8Q5_9GLOM|nr:6067_t:CDS:2 [Dentiscutata erythropus]